VDQDVERQAQRYHVLEDPQRRAIFQFVRLARSAVSRDQVAEHAGVSRSLAAFHLERLLDAGLVTADYARPSGRSGGPGAGRPAKRYRASDAQIVIEIPPRRYALAGRLMAHAIQDSREGQSASEAAVRLAAEEGRRLGREQAPTSVDRCLASLGFEPVTEPSGDVVLANCPFHALAEVARDLVCAMNHSLVGGILDGLDADEFECRLVPGEGRCCVVLAPTGRRMSVEMRRQ
jgi:predicted ArsR family transcriptional regulator